MFKVGPREFEISKSEFGASAHLRGGDLHAEYSLEIETLPIESEDDYWKAKLSTHAALILPSPQLLEGKTFISSCSEDDEPIFSLYMFEHEPIYSPKFSFRRLSVSKFEFELVGSTPNWDETLESETAKVEIKCILDFGGVLVDEPNALKAESILHRIFGAPGWSPPKKTTLGHLFNLEES